MPIETQAFTRRYGALGVEIPDDTSLRFTRAFKAPPQLVFDAHTKPALIRLWLLGPDGWTMPVCEVDLRVGGQFRYEWAKAPDRRMSMSGTYHVIDAPHRLVNTELFDEDWTGGETLCTLGLEATDDGTLMTLSVQYPSKEAREAVLGTGMLDGMEDSYLRLETVLDQ